MTIQVSYDVYASSWGIKQQLRTLASYQKMSLDIETKGIYTKEERKEALRILKDENTDTYLRKFASVVSNNSGLSFPSLIVTTHFIFGVSKSHSIILIPQIYADEIRIWKWVANYEGGFYIHNTLFDLKVMYHRIKKLPKHFIDTALRAKCLINHVEPWKARVGLKELMGPYYDPQWALIDEYEPENLLDPKFLKYAATDGAATYYLHGLIEEQCNG